MVNVKMTNILVSTTQFIVTLTYPVKNKIATSISKKQAIITESVDAVIEITPIVHRVVHPVIHRSKGNETLTGLFYNLLSCKAETSLTKHHQQELHEFLEKCSEKVRKELKENCEHMHVHLENIKADTLFINLFDGSGNLLQSTRATIRDSIAAFRHIKTALLLWPTPKKRSSLLIPGS